MSSRKQRNANYRNSLLSTGPKAESLEHTRFNGVKHGAKVLSDDGVASRKS